MALRANFGRTVVPIQLPIGEEKTFRGIVDLVAMKAWTFATDGSGKATEGAIPPELEGPAQTAREALVEMVAEADDTLMEKFFDAGTLAQDELVDDGVRPQADSATARMAALQTAQLPPTPSTAKSCGLVSAQNFPCFSGTPKKGSNRNFLTIFSGAVQEGVGRAG